MVQLKKFFGLDPDEIDEIQEIGDIFQFGTLWIALFFIAFVSYEYGDNTYSVALCNCRPIINICESKENNFEIFP
ncbi:hypothetical protein ACXGXY_001807 [Campylobacter coli]